MEQQAKKKWAKWLKVFIAVYISCGLALYFFQEKFLFHPEPLDAEYEFQFRQPFTEVYLPVDNGRNLSIIQFTVPDSLRKGIVLYFHGNKANIERYADNAKFFTDHNQEVWMIDYPGFGKTTGERTERVLYSDALTMYTMAKARISSDSIIIYGKSMGTGIAAQLASVRESKRLILETPYYSIDALAARFAFMYPVTWMMNFHLPTFQYIEKVKEPITLFHGTDDNTIPYRHAKRLMKIAPAGTELITIENGGHNDLPASKLFRQKLDSLLR
ncbi:lysophospholipase [Terrimonas sp. NA20]|uniref:Lysophospholipase n=1 Tax=Terrimonas ginsenosidimutans TaxID=2908004 RepID=A0ABS9KWA0_9BACT|nr:alpha/beta fold hydrolase [Terrimonas ginsenosidimutans]MCG2616509.1 lysophospholipase [Terrimonas ginsenosidimutans]